MGIKLVELQVALHRTVDLGKIQTQHNNHGMVIQAHIAEQKKKQDEIKRKKVNDIKSEEKENTSSTQTKQPFERHPHKGNHFDLRG
ncbi:hypothetical protein ACWE42_00055 [Sutcliffiella cohnii]